MQELTAAENQFRRLMQFWVFLFGVGAVFFLFLGDWILSTGNTISTDILRLPLEPMPLPVERFWLSITLSQMTLLVCLCYQIQKDVRANIRLTSLILVAKLTSTLTFLGFFFFENRYFDYLMGSIFCDGPIFLITFIFYKRVMGKIPMCQR